MDPLAEWCARELRLDIDGKIMVIKPSMEHYRKLKSFTKQKTDTKDVEAMEKSAQEMRDLFYDILKTTYPDSKFIDDFLDRYEMQFQISLFVALGWGTKETFEELKKKLLQTSEVE